MLQCRSTFSSWRLVLWAASDLRFFYLLDSSHFCSIYADVSICCHTWANTKIILMNLNVNLEETVDLHELRPKSCHLRGKKRNCHNFQTFSFEVKNKFFASVIEGHNSQSRNPKYRPWQPIWRCWKQQVLCTDAACFPMLTSFIVDLADF